MDRAARPGGKRIVFEGARRHVHLQGRRGPVVVLESGLGGGTLEWGAVATALVDRAIVFRHDRPGLGWSQPRHPALLASRPERFAKAAACELRRLLQHLRLPAPYVLVGHSLGAIHVRVFASLFPEEVAGVVLVDPSHEDQFSVFPRLAMLTRLQHQCARLLVSTGRPGMAVLRKLLLRGYAAECQTPPSPFALSVLDQMDAVWQRPGVLAAWVNEMAGLMPSLEQVRAVSTRAPFPPVPLRVISQGRLPRSRTMQKMLPHWQGMHAGLCQLSPDAEHIIAARSGHLIPLDEPELIANAVKSIIG